MASKVSQLDGNLIARKGNAAPATASQPAADEAPARKPSPRGTAGTIAVTVRLDPERYEKLKILGVRQRRTNQDILVAAIDAYMSNT
jgi:hypothetical protein